MTAHSAGPTRSPSGPPPSGGSSIQRNETTAANESPVSALDKARDFAQSGDHAAAQTWAAIASAEAAQKMAHPQVWASPCVIQIVRPSDKYGHITTRVRPHNLVGVEWGRQIAVNNALAAIGAALDKNRHFIGAGEAIPNPDVDELMNAIRAYNEAVSALNKVGLSAEGLSGSASQSGV